MSTDPAHCIYIFDRSYAEALDALRKLLLPLWGDDYLASTLEREKGRWLILSACAAEPRFFSVHNEADALQFLQTSLDETGRAPPGSGHLSVDWRVAPELQQQLNAAIAEHQRRFTTGVVSRSLQ